MRCGHHDTFEAQGAGEIWKQGSTKKPLWERGPSALGIRAFTARSEETPFPIMRRCPIRLKPNILELFVAGIHCFHYPIEHDETFRNMNLRASSSMCIMRNRKKPSRPGTAFLWALRSGISLCRRARTQASISLTAIGRPLTGTQEHTEHRDLHRNLEARLRSLRRVSPSQRNAFASMTWPSIHPFFTWPFAVYKRMSDLGPNTLAIHEHLVR